MDPNRLNAETPIRTIGGKAPAEQGAPLETSSSEIIGDFRAHEKLDTSASIKIDVQHLNFFYGSKQALYDVSIPLRERQVTALIGPSGCGKSTFLRTLNRMNDLIPGTRTEGKAIFDGQNIYDKSMDVVLLRRRIGMVFQRPNPFPKSIFENVAYGLKVQGKSKSTISAAVEASLRGAALWDEVKDRLHSLGTKLSGGQQQRLTIARALSHQPEILCLDEFSIAIDPVTTMRIEEVLKELQKEMTIILVTNLIQQARRLAARTMFLWNGEIVELDTTEVIFSDAPANRKTYEYVNGIFG